jgi:hypothetical protein
VNLRYGSGVFLGALLPGIAFIGGLFIKLAGVGVTDEVALASLFNLYLLWFFVSVLIGFIPLMITYAKWRESVREVLLYEIGGYALFTPLWLFITTDFSGDSFIELFFVGLQNAVPSPGPGGTIIGVNVPPFLFVPIVILLLIMGLIMLRPSFIEAQIGPSAAPAKPAATTAPRTPAAPAAPTPVDDPLEAELPGVAPPQASVSTLNELKELLTELGTPETAITAILNAGFQTVTDVVSTSSEQLALATGLDKATAENLHMAIQKKVWFGGI